MGILNDNINGRALNELFANYRDVKYMHKISDREFWEGVDEDIKKEIISIAEAHLNYNIPCIKATTYLELFRSGNRVVNQDPYFARRRALTHFVLAECFENKGRFTDDIIDVLWAICEETTWAISAHAKMGNRYCYDFKKNKLLLPDWDYHIIDLFACETAASLSSVVYIMKEALDKETPMICQRVQEEVKRRVIKIFTEYSEMWWMKLGRKTHNWAIWCVANCLWSILLLEKDEDYAVRGIDKVIEICENYLDYFDDDGGCDEGPAYFSKSGLCLYRCIEGLYLASEGKLNAYGAEKVKAILSFFANVMLTDDRSFNYSDAASKISPPLILYSAAKKIDDDYSMTIASKGYIGNGDTGSTEFIQDANDFWYMYETIECYNEVKRYNKPAVLKKDVWYPDNQILVSRTESAVNKGMVLGVKGHNNGVNHNHNDAGGFVLFNNGTPIFIDLGVETYTRQTFSDERYNIWTMRTAYHNLPVIGGVEQKDGIEYRATDVKCNIADAKTELSMDIAKAYPEKVEKWIRKYDLDKDNEVLVITDDFKLDANEEVCFNFMTQIKPELDGKVIKVYDVDMTFEGIDANISIEELPVEDNLLLKSWENKVYRICVMTAEKVSQGKMTFTIKK